MKSPGSSSLTDKGLVRPDNQDAFLDCPQFGLWLVADGMGGHEGGQQASQIVQNTLLTLISQGKSLSRAIETAHRHILEYVQKHPHLQGMGSTVVALKNKNSQYQIAWVGDSRAYLWRPDAEGGELQQLTSDHSLIQHLVNQGALSPEQARQHPDKNIITQCLGAEDIVELHIETLAGFWQPKDKILLCSDGLTNEVTDQEIAAVLLTAPNAKQATTELVQLALNHGGSDNITVQIIESPVDKRLPLMPSNGTNTLQIPLFAWFGLLLLLLVVATSWLAGNLT